jgi:peroxiredoxin Q/BCP
MLSAGSPAPDFDLVAHDGSRVRLSDFAGRRVLLWFYPAADTPG